MTERRTVRVLGRPVSVRSAAGSEPAVVLLHGAGGNEDTLGRLADALAARGVAAHAPSLPGRCGSEGPPCATAAEAGGWAAALLEALALGRPPLVLGHSYGGGVALELAFGRPELASGLVLIATGARLRVHPTILELMEQAVRSGTPAELGRMAWRPDTDPAVIEAAQEVGRRTPPASALADWRAADGFDRMGQLESLPLPTLVLGGSDDALTPPKYTRYLAEHLPNAALRLFEDAGHMLPMERSEEVAQAIEGFREGV